MSDKLKKTDTAKSTKKNARAAILPEISAITAIKKIQLDPYSASEVNSCDLAEEIFKQAKKIQAGDISYIERCLYSQAIALNAMFERMLAQVGGAEFINHVQVSGLLALKAQAQCRATLATLADIRNPQRPTFIKQQNNAINQQVNDVVNLENSKKIDLRANELLSETKNETLDFNRAQETIRINPAMEAVEKINRSKDIKREINK